MSSPNPEFNILAQAYLKSLRQLKIPMKKSGVSEEDDQFSFFSQSDTSHPKKLEWEEGLLGPLHLRNTLFGPITIVDIWEAALSKSSKAVVATEKLTTCRGVGLKLEGPNHEAGVLVAHIPSHLDQSLQTLFQSIQSLGFRVAKLALSTRYQTDIDFLKDDLDEPPIYELRGPNVNGSIVARRDGIAFLHLPDKGNHHRLTSTHGW